MLCVIRAYQASSELRPVTDTVRDHALSSPLGKGRTCWTIATLCIGVPQEGTIWLLLEIHLRWHEGKKHSTGQKWDTHWSLLKEASHTSGLLYMCTRWICSRKQGITKPWVVLALYYPFPVVYKKNQVIYAKIWTLTKCHLLTLYLPSPIFSKDQCVPTREGHWMKKRD